ncbi:MAG TPA: hypothetical protein VD908_04650 [Cytophagales bacterium]|nr:hypothetical protein [Cytophagales bacterium]
MNIPKALISAILIGIAIQTASCSDDNEVKSKDAEQAGSEHLNTDPCPACGMG